MTDERGRVSIREVCDRIGAMDPSMPPGDQLDELVRALELIDAGDAEDRAQALVDANRRLADLEELHNANRMVTVGTLTAGMAHELGTPLGVVLARAQMIVSDENDLAEARRDAEEIIHQVKRMTQMCREVLDFARPKPPTRDPVDVVQVVRQMIALLGPEARKRTATLVLAGKPPPLLVLGDASKLMQIVTNLTINAAQAMPNGGTVTLGVERQRVQPPAAERLAEGEYICIHVEDTGTGIRDGDLGHIFETFFTTKKAEGTGIGLAVSSRLAREHDGWIGVVTQEGHGSTFTVYLPSIVPTLPATAAARP
jgi:two-component system NtrC family sensor kinase